MQILEAQGAHVCTYVTGTAWNQQEKRSQGDRGVPNPAYTTQLTLGVFSIMPRSVLWCPVRCVLPNRDQAVPRQCPRNPEHNSTHLSAQMQVCSWTCVMDMCVSARNCWCGYDIPMKAIVLERRHGCRHGCGHYGVQLNDKRP